MSEPLVSVIIPAYNCEAFLDRSLGSVLRQTWKPLECIVVDDGSRDGTATVAARYGDRIRYVRQDNAGASAARNHGLRLAQGRYIAFLDADDSWVDTKLELQVKAFQAHPGLALVYTRGRYVDDVQVPVHEGLPAPAWNPADVQVFSTFDEVFLNPYLATSTVMVDAEAAREVGGFDPALVTAEDLDFYFKLCWQRRYARIEQPLVYKAEVEGSLGGGPRTYADNLLVIDRFCRTHPEFARDSAALVERSRTYIYSKWIDYLLYHGDGVQARHALADSRGLPLAQRGLRQFKSYLCGPVARIKGRYRPLATVLGPDRVAGL